MTRHVLLLVLWLLKYLVCSCKMPVHIFSVSACMTGCNVFKWLGKDTLITDTKYPTHPPARTRHTFMTVRFGLLPQTPPTPVYNSRLLKTVADLFFFAWIHSVFAWTQLFLLSSKSSQLPAFILSKLFIGSWRVQVRFAASGSTGRMSPLKQWSWTSPLVRASSGPRTSWTVSCRRSTPSPSKHMIVERVLMVPTWRSLTSESCHCHLTSPHSFEVEGFLVMKPVDSWL